MWVARDKDGTLNLYLIKPIRDVEEGIWHTDDWEYPESEFLSIYNIFPDLKWEDEPLEVGLVAVPPQNINLDYEVAKALYSELPDKDSLTGISLKNRIDSYEKS